MRFGNTPLDGVLVLEPEIYRDNRGIFFTSIDDRLIEEELGIRFVQHSHSVSHAGVVRGLHYQDPVPQPKLIMAARGVVFDVIVDIRPDSGKFGQWHSVTLNSENRKQVFIPAGFAHGFMALEDETEVIYALGAFYEPEGQKVIRWDDPDIGIEWPGGFDIIVSEKDQHGISLREL